MEEEKTVVTEELFEKNFRLLQIILESVKDAEVWSKALFEDMPKKDNFSEGFVRAYSRVKVLEYVIIQSGLDCFKESSKKFEEGEDEETIKQLCEFVVHGVLATRQDMGYDGKKLARAFPEINKELLSTITSHDIAIPPSEVEKLKAMGEALEGLTKKSGEEKLKEHLAVLGSKLGYSHVSTVEG